MNVTKTAENQLGIDPFRRAITIASLCHIIYNEQLMKPETIAILNDNGVTTNDRSSKKSTMWLKFLSQKLGVKIEHSENSNEEK